MYLAISLSIPCVTPLNTPTFALIFTNSNFLLTSVLFIMSPTIFFFSSTPHFAYMLLFSSSIALYASVNDSFSSSKLKSSMILYLV